MYIVSSSVQKKKKTTNNKKHSFYVKEGANLSIWDHETQMLEVPDLANKATEGPVKFENCSNERL